ncbi:MAG: hypothetical protein Alis3KO_00720 [Aliiglaciecola sp.]
MTEEELAAYHRGAIAALAYVAGEEEGGVAAEAIEDLELQVEYGETSELFDLLEHLPKYSEAQQKVKQELEARH